MFSSKRFIQIFVSASIVASVRAFAPNKSNLLSSRQIVSQSEQQSSSSKTFRTTLCAFETKEKTGESLQSPTSGDTLDETTKNYGLEAGLFQSLKQEDGGKSAKELLAKYGVAYLATSIPLALVSFAICFFLVDSGVDVAGLLGNVGIEVNESGEKVGTFAIAYAAHKAASPIRFPPTVLLTPVVAKILGKEPEEETV
jgi:hypothetical protein